MAELVTDRLLLRPLAIEVCQAIVSGTPGQYSWAPGYPTDGDVVIASIAVEAGAAYDSTTPWGPLQICLNDANRTAIGGVGAIHPPDEAGSVEVGYGIAESVRGRGLALEAVNAFIASLRLLEVRTVVAVISPGNGPSQRLAQSAGFVYQDLFDAGDDGVMQRWTLDLAQ